MAARACNGRDGHFRRTRAEADDDHADNERRKAEMTGKDTGRVHEHVRALCKDEKAADDEDE